MKNKTVAIVGATGAVGREFIGCIESRGIDIKGLKLLASARSAGKTYPFRGKDLIVEELTAAIRTMAKDEGIALVLVEQHAEVALGMTRDAIVIERGVVAHRAPSAELLGNQAVLDRYVGLNLREG